jgi:hypothetical protein
VGKEVKEGTEALLIEVLLEILKLLKRQNEQQAHEELESKLAEIRAKKWGYPTPRRRGR